MKGHLSPQQELIVSILRDMKFHCGREWLHMIKDDRARISNLNTFYMAQRGYRIEGEACKGRSCGVSKCPLFRRKAVKLGATANTEKPHCTDCSQNTANLLAFDLA